MFRSAQHNKITKTHSASSRKVAFTLAEVLITLGIIGIVVAITLPSLINQTQNKQLHTQFKKAYSELTQVSSLFYVNEGISVNEYNLSHSSKETMEKFLTYYKSGIKTSDYVWSSTDADGNPKTFPHELYALQGSNGKRHPICDIMGTYTDLQGRTLSMNDRQKPNENGPILCIDINGYKKPNRYGKDYFLFLFTTDGGIIPMGESHPNNPGLTGNTAGNFSADGPDYCKKNSNYLDQLGCAYYALSDTHPTEQGENYWQDFLGKN